MRTQTALAALIVALLPLAACGQPASTDAPTAEAPAASPEKATPDPEAATPVEGTDPAPPVAPPAEPPATPAPGEQGGGEDWRGVASSADARALGRLGQAWRLARAEAEDKGFAAQVEALGPLVDPNAALAGRLQPPPGVYRCRTIKLGSIGEGGLAYVDYPWFRCVVELTAGGDLILMKTTGSQRTRGLLYPNGERQLVFIGAQAWGADETKYPLYGQMPERDQIGVLERIGDHRWRLVIPWPKQEAKLELLELVR